MTQSTETLSAFGQRFRVPLLALSLILALIGMALLGFFTTMSFFVQHDDEGYMMATMQGFLAGGALYDSVYTQYGPFFVFYWSGLFELLPGVFTFNGVRLTGLLMWLASSVLLGATAFHLTRSAVAGGTALLGTFIVLIPIGLEPMHPLSLIVLLLSIAVFLSARGGSPPARRTSIALGAILGALCFVKPNTGLLATGALIAALVLISLPTGRGSRLLWSSLLSLIIIGPILLMTPQLTEPSFQRFAVLILLSILSIAVTLFRNPVQLGPSPPSSPYPYLWPAAVSFLLVVGLLLLLTLASGTSPGGIIQGLLLEPLRTRDAAQFGFPLSAGSIDLALVGLIGAIITRLWLTANQKAIQVLRIVGGAAIIWGAIDPTLSGLVEPPPVYLTALAFLWVGLLSSPTERETNSNQTILFPATFIASLAVLVSVNAYPIAGGAQVTVATAFPVLIGVLALWRSWAGSRSLQLSQWTGSAVVGFGICVVLLGKIILQGYTEKLPNAAYQYRNNKPLQASGAGLLRFDPKISSELNRVTSILKRNCNTYFSRPGLNKFYFLADLPLATNLNVNNWAALLSDEEQRTVLRDLREGDWPRLCIVTNSKWALRDESAWEVAYPEANKGLLDFLGSDRRLLIKAGDWRVYVKERNAPGLQEPGLPGTKAPGE